MHTNFSAERLEPALAETLPVAQYIGDSLTRLSYQIRSVATWDDGRPVLATDVDFTLKLMFCPGLPNETARLQYNFIRALIPDPDDSRHFTLECRGQSLEYPETSGDFFILPEAAIDPKGLLRRFSLAELQRLPANAPPDSALAAVARRFQAFAPGALPGCGPYRLSAWEKDRYLTFRRKENWWGSKLEPTPFVLQARPSQLDFVIIPDASTASLALQRGDLDVFPQVPAREFARLRNSRSARTKLAFYSVPSHDVVTAGFNTRRPALADALTRKALGRCFDTAGLIKATQLGAGQQTVGIISPLDRANYNDSLRPLPFDLTTAASMLRQAGWRREAKGDDAGWVRTKPQGKPQRLRLVVRYRADEPTFATAALQFQAAAASIGVAVSLLPTESGSFTAALKAGDFDMYVRTLRGNPFMFNYIPLYHSRALGQSNVTGFSTPASDRLIDEITTAKTPQRKSQLLRRFQAMLQTEAPIIPLFFLPNRVVARRDLTGLHVNSLKPGFAIGTVERTAVPAPTP
ncbi:ABC transporter substrate-binding protein [Hymenobacter sp. B1770]|uniref:ABC transporter substrate-binding protein n=1 Tax=Hymenobacter sp. B1770 TaxID=1718788 RepID=UPI003CF10BE3